MNNFHDLYPEILAGISFLPCGIYMSYLIYGANVTIDGLETKFWPYIIGIVLAFVTGGLLTITKLYFKKYKFHHFYYMIVGNAFLFLSGIFLQFQIKDVAAVYMGVVGHGIIYIPAITYINIRATKDQYRYFKISLCHCWYILGFAIGASIFLETSIEADTNRFEIIGLILIIFTCILAFLFMINEFLQFHDDYDYKKSLNNDFERENEDEEILLKKRFEIQNDNLLHSTRYGQQRNGSIHSSFDTSTPDTTKEYLLLIFTLFVKLRTLWLFYFPFLYINIVNGLLLFNETDLHKYAYFVHWFAFIGTISSTILLIYFSTRIIFIISSGLQIIMIIILIVACSIEPPSLFVLITFWFLFLTMGFGYSIPDINLVDFTNLKYNELIFAFGYLMEFLILGFLHHYSLVPDVQMFIGEILEVILPHTLAMCISIAIMLVMAAIIMPRTFGKTSLEVRNMILFSTQTNQTNNSNLTNIAHEHNNNFNLNPGFVHNQYPQHQQNIQYPNKQPPNYYPPSPQPEVDTTNPQFLNHPEEKYDYKQILPKLFLPRPKVGSPQY